MESKTVVYFEKNGVQYLQFKKLLEYKDKITHAYGIGLDVDYRTNGDNKEKAIQDYDNLCRALDLDYKNILKPNQTHTKRVEIVEMLENHPDLDNEKFNNTDGAITDKKDIVLATCNADCILLLFYDPVKNVVANTHSGWKGTWQRISVETVKKMKQEYGCNPSDIICCMCPSIRKCHFEVEKDVRDLFYEEFKNLNEINQIIEETVPNKKWNIDTVLINRVLLKEQGLKEENIIDSGLCSVCNSDIMHSCRAEGEGYGLCTAVISLK